MILFIKLFLAHLLGDFLLQPNSWVSHKIVKKQKSIFLYLHSILHGLLAWLLVFEKDFWIYALAITISHGLIDLAKLQFQTEKTKRSWFIFDQFLHLLVLAAVVIWYQNSKIIVFPEIKNHLWIVLTAVIFLTKPTSILIKNIISIWTPDENTNADHSLQNAGNYIGILERLFILCFILTGHFEATGFLLGAKSIFRFGDLRMARDRKLTEYVLIGTLISFGIAIGIGLLAQFFIQNFSVYFLD